MTVLLTGATGFLGAQIAVELNERRTHIRTLSRSPSGVGDPKVGDLTRPDTLSGVCDGIDIVIHCAGFAHAQDDGRGRFEARHQAINHEGTRHLLEVAGRAGVRRFVFLSSVKAMASPGDRQVDEEFAGEPDSAYGRAKRAAENAAFESGAKYGMEIVNLRLAMVYGKGDRGNLARMVRGVRSGWFPPLPETGNHRSMLHVDDAVDAIVLASAHPSAANGTFIVASREAPSGAELYDAIRLMLGKRLPAWRIPEAALRSIGLAADRISRLTGRPLSFSSEMIDRLLGSAWYCPARIARALGWQAQVPLSQGLRDYLVR